YNP
ncbi:putative transport protein, partial [Chlamydia psittaci 84-8471/1]